MTRAPTAVMARRREPPDSLDFFPTPPWATRALCSIVLPQIVNRYGGWGSIVWEPAAGEGHMAEVLGEYFAGVKTSDIHDYGRGDRIGDFVGGGLDRLQMHVVPDWIITNPPFNQAVAFAQRAIAEARIGCALLLRTAWLESDERWQLFRKSPPTHVAVFMGRVAMVKGRWDPSASTATSYAWFVWHRPAEHAGETRLLFIPPDTKQRLTRDTDVARFGTDASPGPLFGET
jgi:hypothetical protein